jgi:hypothetical protein
MTTPHSSSLGDLSTPLSQGGKTPSPITIQEIRKNVNIEEEIATDLLFRQSKVLYPEVEEWVLKLAIEAYQNQLKQEKAKKMEEIN